LRLNLIYLRKFEFFLSILIKKGKVSVADSKRYK